MSSTGVCFLFTQAEVGIRGGHVTGVQTCALPICPRTPDRNPRGADVQVRRVDFDQAFVDSTITNTSGAVPTLTALERSEERRVGKYRRQHRSQERSKETIGRAPSRETGPDRARPR